MVNALAVVGTGLIGASAALAARRAGVTRVTGWDADRETLAIAAGRDAVEPAGSLADALAGADVALVAVPVVELPAVVRDVLAAAPAACAVTDVGSTKGAVCAAAGGDPRFVGGHPICGAETSGPARATGELFDGATWFLTPLARTAPDAYREVHALVGVARRAADRDRPGRTRPAGRRSRATCPTRSPTCSSTRPATLASRGTSRWRRPAGHCGT